MTGRTILDLIVVGVCLTLAVIGALGAAVGYRRRARSYPPELMRTNYRGLEVPAILGDALVLGSVAGLVALFIFEMAVQASIAMAVATVVVVVTMWVVGAWDDRRGDERARGFAGHLGALRSREMTGGLLKIAGGLVAGVVAAVLIPARGATPLGHVIETVLLVALTANLMNLLDRAPGRTGKFAVLTALPLIVLGDRFWILAVMPVLGALVICLRHDLAERAMLGDAGANPVGAVLGLGLAASLPEPWRLVAITILLALNVASEKWSFSRAIEATPPLKWFDGLGRKDQLAAK